MRNRIHRRRPAAGFTLMEVLLVLIILVMLGSLAMQAFTGTRQQADINTAKTQAQAIAKAAQSYELTMRQYPTGIQDLFQAPSDAKPGRWNGPYLEGNAAPLDPWDNAYQYANPGTHNPTGIDVWSMGPNEVSGDADDIGNWAAATE